MLQKHVADLATMSAYVRIYMQAVVFTHARTRHGRTVYIRVPISYLGMEHQAIGGDTRVHARGSRIV